MWFEGKTPRGQWRVANAQVTAENGAEPFIQRSNELGFGYFFNRDGAMAPGKSGVQLNFSRPAGATFEVAGEAEQFENSSKTFEFADIPFPAKAGEMVTPKMIKENADGSKLILWKVGRFDTQHQPIVGPYSPNPNKPIDWEGLVLVWEYRPADKDKEVKTKFNAVDFRDDNGGKFSGGITAKGDGMRFSGHYGDVWRTTKEKDSSGLTFKETANTWYSLFKPLPSVGAKSLATTMKIEENAIIKTLRFALKRSNYRMPPTRAENARATTGGANFGARRTFLLPVPKFRVGRAYFVGAFDVALLARAYNSVRACLLFTRSKSAWAPNGYPRSQIL